MTDRSLTNVLTIFVLITLTSSSILETVRNTFPQCTQLDSKSYPDIKDDYYIEDWIKDKLNVENFDMINSPDFKKESGVSNIGSTHWYKEYTITEEEQINSLLLNHPIMNNKVREVKNTYYLSNWRITCSYQIMNNNENTVYFNLLIAKDLSSSLYSSLKSSTGETTLFWRIDLLIDIFNGVDKIIEGGYFIEDFNLKSIFLKHTAPGAEFFPFLNSHDNLVKKTNNSSLRKIHLALANIVMKVLNPEIFRASQLNSDAVNYNHRCTSYEKKNFFHPMYCRFFESIVVTLVEENGAARLDILIYKMLQELTKLDRKASEDYKQKQNEIIAAGGDNVVLIQKTIELRKLQRPYEQILKIKLEKAQILDQEAEALNQKTTIAKYVQKAIYQFAEVKEEIQIDVDL